MNENYNHKIAEKKWQAIWEEQNIFKFDEKSEKEKILRFRNVSISIWKNPYGSSKKLHYWRCYSSF